MAVDEGTVSFKRNRSKTADPQGPRITATRQIWLLEAIRTLRAPSLPVNQRRHLCDPRQASLPLPILTWIPCSRITNSRCLGKASRTAGLQVDKAKSAPVSYWIGQLLEQRDSLESDPKEEAQAPFSTETDRGTPAPPNLNPIRDPSLDHPLPLTPPQATPHAKILSPPLSRSSLTVQRLQIVSEFLWIRQERLPSTRWPMSTNLSPNTTKPLLSHHNIPLPHKTNRVVDSRGGSV